MKGFGIVYGDCSPPSRTGLASQGRMPCLLDRATAARSAFAFWAFPISVCPRGSDQFQDVALVPSQSRDCRAWPWPACPSPLTPASGSTPSRESGGSTKRFGAGSLSRRFQCLPRSSTTRFWPEPKEALRARKASGRPLGRPKGPDKSKLDPFRPEIEALLTNGSARKFIAKRCNTTPDNLANWMKKNGIRKPKA